MTPRAWALAILAALGSGFLAGRWSIPRGKPVPLAVGPSRPIPERDLSPEGEVRTVVVTRVIPGPPAPPPAPVPPELGQHLQTTSTPLPALPAGTLFHEAIFGKLEGQRLVLRPVQWAEGPQGRVSLPEGARTLAAPVSFHLPAPPAPPRWGLIALGGIEDGKPVYGAAVQAWKGPLGLQAGQIGRTTFIGGGARW